MERQEHVLIPVVSEQITAGIRESETGGVRVTKQVTHHDETVEQNLRKETVVIKRVQMSQQVDGPQAVRQVGDTTIVSIVEESLRVEKVWILKEEIHLTRTQETVPHFETVSLGTEQALIERLDAEGQAIAHPVVQTVADPAVSLPARPLTPETETDLRRPLGRKSMLK